MLSTPSELVEGFKKSGEFDRLRRELLAQFQRSDRVDGFNRRIEEIIRQRMESDQNLQHLPPDSVHRELMQEMDRYPLVERAAAEAPLISDANFASGTVRPSLQRMLNES